MIGDVVQMSFDYSALDEPTRAFVQGKAQAIHARLKRTAEDIIAIGQDLIAVKARLHHGQFGTWLCAEFGMSDRHALNFMRVASRFGSKSEIISDLPMTILYELAAPSTPDAIIEQVQTGQIERTLPAIREAKQEYQQPAPLPTYPDYVHPLERGLYDAFSEVVAREQAQVMSVRNVDNIPVAVPHISSKNNEWYTPEKYVTAARELMGGIDLDPASCASANRTVKAARYYDISQNGLNEEWKGLIWLNPPYGYTDGESNQSLWSRYLVEQYNKRNVKEAVLLVNAAVDTNWFHDLLAYFPVCLTRGRINFTTPETILSGSTHGSAFFYLGHTDKIYKFRQLFGTFGTVVKKWH